MECRGRGESVTVKETYQAKCTHFLKSTNGGFSTAREVGEQGVLTF